MLKTQETRTESQVNNIDKTVDNEIEFTPRHKKIYQKKMEMSRTHSKRMM